MKVIVDTCIWSLALRRNKIVSEDIILQLNDLINDSRVQMIGPIRQEILSGIITSNERFHVLRQNLSAFRDLSIQSCDYEFAAELYNTCRRKGLQGSNTDFLICSIAINYKMAIFTTDNDFKLFSKILPITLL